MIADNLVSNNILTYTPEAKALDLALSVIVPTRNEAGNVEALLTGLKKAFDGRDVEVIFVDDSTDETPQVVEAAIQKFPMLNVRLIHRTPEQRTGGLGGAVVTGLKAVHCEYACIMDGDLQHPPELVPILLRTAIEKQADLVLASRRSADSELTGLSIARDLVSRGLDMVARVLFPRQLNGVSDPLTGFFLVRVKTLELGAFRPKGFKILMEILIRNPKLRKAEVPFHFGLRHAGESKATASEAWKYFNLLLTLRFGEATLRFLAFALVGVSGILVNSLALYVATDLLNIYYMVSAVIATMVSTLWNFGLIEIFVFGYKNQANGRARRLGLFFLMNLAALLLRTPIIYLLTDVLGIYYVVSNLVSLVILTVMRFALSDRMIWGQTSSVSPINQPAKL
jgi:dolichol-phosphate mannosyltransferase